MPRGARPSLSPRTSRTPRGTRSGRSTSSAVRYATSCSAFRSRIATTSWSVRLPKRWSGSASSRSARTFPVFLHPKTHEEYALRAPSAKRPRLQRVHGPRLARGHAGGRPQTPGSHHQRDGEGRGWDSDRSLWRQEGSRVGRVAPRERGICGGPGPHPPRRALCGALRFPPGRRNPGTYEAHGRFRRNRLPGPRARVAGVLARPG